MSERTSYEPGTPCWVDLGSPDLGRVVEFYGGLFGWDVPGVREPRADRRLPPGDAARQAGRRDDAADAGGPAAGLEHLRLGRGCRCDRGQGQARPAAPCIAEPMDVMDLGRMAVFADPTGAVFGIWQPGTFIGAGLVNEPGALVWNELNTRDLAAAKAFYGAVFGWGFEEATMGETGTYTTIKLGGRPRRRHARHDRAGVPTRSRRTGRSTSRSRTPTRRSAKATETGGGVVMGADRHPESAASRSSPTPSGPFSR